LSNIGLVISFMSSCVNFSKLWLLKKPIFSPKL
jgi:hypothetical protein